MYVLKIHVATCTYLSREFPGKVGTEPYTGSTAIVSLDEYLSHVPSFHVVALYFAKKVPVVKARKATEIGSLENFSKFT